jgi:hypothetical protein
MAAFPLIPQPIPERKRTMKLEIIGVDEETRKAVAKVIAAGPPTTRPLAERITQGPNFITQKADGIIRIHSRGGSPLAVIADKPEDCEVAQANAILVAETFNVTHETGRTPRQLADERAELIAVLQDFAALEMARYSASGMHAFTESGMHKIPDEWGHLIPATIKARELLTRLTP